MKKPKYDFAARLDDLLDIGEDALKRAGKHDYRSIARLIREQRHTLKFAVRLAEKGKQK